MTIAGRPRAGAAIAIALGVLALIVATVVGWNAGWLEAVVSPPPIVRAFLVGLTVAVGVMLLTRSITQMSASGERSPGQADVPGLIRAVRLAFLAVAAFAAAAGWALGPSPPADRGRGHRRHRRRRDVVPAARRR